MDSKIETSSLPDRLEWNIVRPSRKGRQGARTIPGGRPKETTAQTLNLELQRGRSFGRVVRADANPLEGIRSAQSTHVLYVPGSRSPTRAGHGLALRYPDVKPAPEVLQPVDNARVIVEIAGLLDIMAADGSAGVKTDAAKLRAELDGLHKKNTAKIKQACIRCAMLMDRYETESLMDHEVGRPRIPHAWKRAGGLVRSFANYYDITVKNAAERARRGNTGDLGNRPGIIEWGLLESAQRSAAQFSATSSFRDVLCVGANLAHGYCRIGWPSGDRTQYFEQYIHAVSGNECSGENVDDLFTKFLNDCGQRINADGQIFPAVAYTPTPATTRLPYSYVTYENGEEDPTYIDAEFKILTAIDNKLRAIKEKFGLSDNDFEGPLHLGSNFQACDPCSKAIKAFQQFWPNVLLHFMGFHKFLEKAAYAELPREIQKKGVEEQSSVTLDAEVVAHLQRRYKAMEDKARSQPISPSIDTMSAGIKPFPPAFDNTDVSGSQPSRPDWFGPTNDQTSGKMARSETMSETPAKDPLDVDLRGEDFESWEDWEKTDAVTEAAPSQDETDKDGCSAIRSLIDYMLLYPGNPQVENASSWITDGTRPLSDVLALLATMRTEGGASALHFAARHDNPVAIGLLIEAGAPLEARTPYQQGDEATPLAWAHAAKAETAAKLLALHQLAQAMHNDTGPSADAMTQTWPDYPSGGTSVEQIVDKLGAAVDCWARLVAGGAAGDVNAGLDEGGATALHLAAALGREQAASSLMDAGANPDVEDKFGASPFQYAANHGHDETMFPILWPSER